MDTFVKYYFNKHAEHAYFYIKNWLTKHKKHQDCVVIGIFIALSLLISLLFMLFTSKNGLPQGDYTFHDTRLTEIAQDIYHGNLLLANQYEGSPRGIASAIFYPWLTLLSAALLEGVLRPVTISLLL